MEIENTKRLGIFINSVRRYKSIDNFPYLVSDCGRIFGLTKKWSERKTSLDKDGYSVIRIKSNAGAWTHCRVHRLVIFAFGEKSEKNEVNHINGIRNDNRIENLEWCTHAENIQHSVKIGSKGGISNNIPKEFRTPEAKAKFVAKVICAYNQGDDLKKIQSDFGITLKAIHLIVRRPSCEPTSA